MAAGMGAKVIILDLSLERLRYLSDVMPANVQLIHSNRHNILEDIETADLVVGGVLIPGAKAPKLVRREDLKRMQPGSVIVDVAIDQGGCVETIHATTHENPTYVVDGVIHYGVANMPGGVPRTSTLALTNATLPYALAAGEQGLEAGAQGESGAAQGAEHRRRTGDVPGGGRGVRVAVRAGGEVRGVNGWSEDCGPQTSGPRSPAAEVGSPRTLATGVRVRRPPWSRSLRPSAVA